jgi:hypothetical protein
MPPRAVTVAIVVFWLVTLGWFFQHDVWPRLRPGERPPYTLDLSQEVTGRAGPRFWDVRRNGRTIGKARTWVRHNEDDDTYSLISKFNFHDFQVGVVQIRKMESTYRVTRNGYLRALDVEVEAAFDKNNKPEPDFQAVVRGEVRNGVLTPHWTINSPLVFLFLGKTEFDSQPVDVADNRSLLNPTQPWNRLLNVQENRTWRIELFDPLMNSVSNLLPGLGPDPGVRALEAGVLQGTQDLTWNNEEVPCLVIEYHDSQHSGVSGRTWVRQEDGLVLRQEATRNDGKLDEEKLVLERLPK